LRAIGPLGWIGTDMHPHGWATKVSNVEDHGNPDLLWGPEMVGTILSPVPEKQFQVPELIWRPVDHVDVVELALCNLQTAQLALAYELGHIGPASLKDFANLWIPRVYGTSSKSSPVHHQSVGLKLNKRRTVLTQEP
jgi:hypothetical protein